MSAVRVSYEITRAEMSTAGRLIAKSLFKRRTLSLVCGALLIMMSVVAMVSQPGFSVKIAALPFIAGTIMILTPWAVSWFFGVYAPSKNPAIGETATWLISADQLSCKVRGNEVTFGWDKVQKVREIESGYLLFTGPAYAHWLPKRGFNHAQDLDAFRTFARQRQILSQG